MKTKPRGRLRVSDRFPAGNRAHLPLREAAGWVVGAVVVLPGLVVMLLAVIGPWIAPEPLGASVATPFQPPGGGHLFGTDRLGRDLWSQILHGGRDLLLVPLAATAVTVAVGTAVGVTIGYLRGAVDMLALVVVDLLLVLPPVIVMLVLANGWGAGVTVIVVTMVLTGAPFLARLARASTLEVIRAPFVQVSVTQGDSTLTILRRDVLPNVSGPVLADSGMRFVGALYLVAALSILGFGPQTPATNWAVMLRENAEGAGLNLWAMVLPALMIALLSISANVLLQMAAERSAR